MSHSRLILLVDGTLVLAAVAYGCSQRVALCLSILAATAILVICQWMLIDGLRSTGQSVRVTAGVRQPHYVQALCQLGIYIYWGLYWDQVRDFAPLIVVQIVFAYAIEMLLSWWKYRSWRVGFGPLPIVFSTNLFLWFKEDYFFLQILMIALCYISRELIRWNRDGRHVHIFNPSAFALTVACLGLMFSSNLQLTLGVDIIASFALPPNFIEVVFLLGLIVQLLYGTALVTLGAVLAHCAIYLLSALALGAPINPHPIDLAVFLGFTFLVTDPSTSPQSRMGKFLFGLIYGGGVFCIYILLRLTHQPAFVDKILLVPVVNLLVRVLDNWGEVFHRRVANIRWLTPLGSERLAWTGIYAALFVLIVPFEKTPHAKMVMIGSPGARASESVIQLLVRKEYCREFIPDPYRPFGFRKEVDEFRQIKKVYRSGVGGEY